MSTVGISRLFVDLVGLQIRQGSVSHLSVSQTSLFDLCSPTNCLVERPKYNKRNWYSEKKNIPRIRKIKYNFKFNFFNTDINECSSNPCLNGGKCVGQFNGYVCNCQPGYGGVLCQTGEYFAYFDVIHLAHINYVFFIFCGFIKSLAIFSHDTDINECSSNPCLNGGKCVDQVNDFVCSCQAGYKGARCQISEYFDYFDVVQSTLSNFF